MSREGKVVAKGIRGTVKWYDDQRSYGFITRDVFVHRTAIGGPFMSLSVGQDVEFDIVQGSRGHQASNVIPVKSVAIAKNDEPRNVIDSGVAMDICQEDVVDLTKPFDLANVTFMVEEKPIYYNRGMLAMHSPYFKRLFYGANAGHDKEIQLKDKKFGDVLTMLRLLKLDPNSNEQLITDANVESLLKLAEEYQLSHVTAECQNFLLLNWKGDETKLIKGLQLSARFGLRTAFKAMPHSSSVHYPELLTDENVEQFLAIAKECKLANITDLCEKHLLENWKQAAVHAVEISAKFGLEKALIELLEVLIITDDNIEQLLNLCQQYSLPKMQAACATYIMENWITTTDKALRAVEIAHELKVPKLAKAFIPLAACRPLAEIDKSIDKLSTKLFCAIVHAALSRVRNAFEDFTLELTDQLIGCCNVCNENHWCCTCVESAPKDALVEKLLKRES